MPALSNNQFFDDTVRAHLDLRLRANGRRLTDREVELLRLRAGLADDHFHTCPALAERYGISLTRVRQIEKRALEKLDDQPDLGPPGHDLFGGEPTALGDVDLEPERPGVIGQLVPLATFGAGLTPAQARTVLLAREARTGDRLRDLMASWLATTESPHTRAAYLRDISQYFDFCVQHDCDPLAVRIQDFTRYREHLAQFVKPNGLPYARSTRVRKIAVISSFYRHMVTVDAMDRSPVTHRFSDKGDPPDKALTVEETRALFTDAETGHQTLGARCASLVVELLFTMGLRVSEVCNLDIDKLHWVENAGRRYRSITFIAKGDKKRTRSIPAQVDTNRLIPYLAQRPRPADGKDALALLLTLDGRRLTRKQIYKLVRRAHVRGLIERDVSPHWGRHTFKVRAVEAGLPLEQVQVALGHESIVTTQRYGQARLSVVNDPSHFVAAGLYAARNQESHTPSPPHTPWGETDDPYNRSA